MLHHLPKGRPKMATLIAFILKVNPLGGALLGSQGSERIQSPIVLAQNLVATGFRKRQPGNRLGASILFSPFPSSQHLIKFYGYPLGQL